MIHEENWERVFDPLNGLINNPGFILVGSAVTLYKEGNDIDLAIPYSAYLYLSGINKLDGFIVTSRDDPEYDRSDISCLVQTMRGGVDGQINILCVNDAYIMSYYAAVEEQRRNPDKYMDREARVNLYQKYELITRDLLNGQIPGLRLRNGERGSI